MDSITMDFITSAVLVPRNRGVVVQVGSALAYPYYAYPYPAYPVYADQVYAPAPAYQPQTQVSVAPVCYASGCYRLQGDGVTVAYAWVWVPAAPAAPPAPPAPPSR